MSTRTFAIVGAGLAGATAAETLRTGDSTVTSSCWAPSRTGPTSGHRCPRSTCTAAPSATRCSCTNPSWYAEQRIDLRLDTTVTALDRGAHELVTGAGDRVRYDRLLLATGATPRRLTVPGSDADRVHYLRTLDDSDRLRAALRPGTKVVVIGGGWIGLETAAAAVAAGAEVTVLEQAELPLVRVLGPARGNGVRRPAHRARRRPALRGRRGGASAGGARCRRSVPRRGHRDRRRRDRRGRRCRAERRAGQDRGLAVDNGILVDEHLRTSDPDITAAGDVANAAHPLLGRRIRVEHWANASHQPVVAARTMLGQDATYDRLPFFFTDQYDLGMEYTGHAPDHDEVVIRGDLAAREFIAFWLADGRVQAGMNVNVWDVADDIERLIRSGVTVDTTRLADPAVRR